MSKGLSKKQKNEARKFVRKHFTVIVAIVLVVAILLTVAYFMGWLDFLFKPKQEETLLSTAGGYETQVDSFGSLKVNFLNVGQGDGILIVLPDGKSMLIDSGDSTSDRDVISQYINRFNLSKIDYLLLTHSDSDHVGNMDWVLENYQVNFVFRPNVYSDNSISSGLSEDFNTRPTNSDAYICTSNIYAKFLVAVKNEGCSVELFNKDSDFENKMISGESKMSYKFDFLTPTAKREEIAYKNKNDYSPIMMLEYAGKRIMFNGDAEETALGEYVSTYGNANNVDVLKVGHHGSRNATTTEFVTDIDPEYAVIQNGFNKTYKHPHQETLDILHSHDGGVTLYRNDTNGNITLIISSTGEMSWELEDTNMENNWKNGTEMLELKEQGKLGSLYSSAFGDILTLAKAQVIDGSFGNTKRRLVA